MELLSWYPLPPINFCKLTPRYPPVVRKNLSVIETATTRGLFFDYLFGEQAGYLCIATATQGKANFKEHYFEWPRSKKEAISFIEATARTKNVWFCVNLLETSKRNKENALPCNFVWSEFDTEVDLDTLEPAPSCIVQSSPGKFHCYWRLAHIIAPEVAEEYSKRITYQYGADKSGWPLAKLLRVPLTFNHKYEESPEVAVLKASEDRLPISVFETLQIPSGNGSTPTNAPDMPDITTLPETALVVHKYSYQLANSPFMRLYGEEPHSSADWSKLLWRLINLCVESGMEKQETFSVALTAKCNKYEREGRPPHHLWREVVKAHAIAASSFTPTGEIKPLAIPDIVPMDYEPTANFVYEYKAWASRATDAVPEFHELSAFILLSAILSSSVKLKVDWGTLYPNLWGLILGDSTLTRKTTAMRMAMDLLLEIDDSLLLATDGSSEGLLTGLSARPKRVSIFFKDEISGFFDSINRKDYLAGMPEFLTELYDVPSVRTRILRKETITISYPFFIFFGGGIREKVFEQINEEMITSGFLPRFLVVNADADVSRIRRTGPPTQATESGREELVNKLKKLNTIFRKEVEIKVGPATTSIQAEYDAYLTEEAWQAYGDIEHQLVTAANDSIIKSVALPTFTRLAFSILKMAVLLAAARGKPDDNNRLCVTLDDVYDAAYYGRRFGTHTIHLLTSAGLNKSEKQLQRIIKGISEKPGITRSELSQRHRLRAKESKEIIETLVERGLIEVRLEGRTMHFYSVEG